MRQFSNHERRQPITTGEEFDERLEYFKHCDRDYYSRKDSPLGPSFDTPMAKRELALLQDDWDHIKKWAHDNGHRLLKPYFWLAHATISVTVVNPK